MNYINELLDSSYNYNLEDVPEDVPEDVFILKDGKLLDSSTLTTI